MCLDGGGQNDVKRCAARRVVGRPQPAAVAEGMSNPTIAAHLRISGYTVKFHVASILTKLGAASRTQAVTLGVRHGLISL